MSETFRAVPNGTIRLTAATVAGAAPLLAGLPTGGGATVLVQNRGAVAVLIEFGAKFTMDLPVAPGPTTGGARSIPAGGVTLVRLQQGERHVAVAVASGTPDVEFTVGDGGESVFAVPGSGGGGGGSTGSVTAAGANGTQAQAVQGITNGVPVPSKVLGADGATDRQIKVTTTGALEPPTAASGKVVETSVALTANTSTQIVAARADRIALEIQSDGTAPVGLNLNGGTLTSATAAPKVMPSGSYPLYTAPIAPLTAVTAYTGTAQTVRVTEYLR